MSVIHEFCEFWRITLLGLTVPERWIYFSQVIVVNIKLEFSQHQDNPTGLQNRGFF